MGVALHIHSNSSANHCPFLYRNETAAEHIIAELHTLKPDNGPITFIKADVTLLQNVDDVCADIQRRETKLNLLFLTPGFISLAGREETREGLDSKMTANYYARMRFTTNLLPLLSAAAAAEVPTSFARVVSVLAAGSEGPLVLDDLDLKRHYSLRTCMKHSIVMTDFFFEEAARRAPTVSFVHEYPGWVKTGFFRSGRTVINLLGQLAYVLLGPWMVPFAQSGERHLYIATSAAYPAAEGGKKAVEEEGRSVVQVARGSDGVVGSGSYLLNWDGGTTGKMDVLSEHRERGVRGMVWEHTMKIFERVKGMHAG